MNVHFAFLDDLRASGATNMYGAAPHLEQAFGLSKADARRIVLEWIESRAKQTC